MADETLTQLAKLKLLLGSDAGNYSDDLLNLYLSIAKKKILNKRYPFGNSTVTEVPDAYSELQVNLACCYATKSGADGEDTHTEGSVSRKFTSEEALLKEVIPTAEVPA